jgi:hypothetical protein
MKTDNLYKKIIMLSFVSLTLLHSVPNHAMSGYMPSKDTLGLFLSAFVGGALIGHCIRGAKQNNDLSRLQYAHDKLITERGRVYEGLVSLFLGGIYASENKNDADLVLSDHFTHDVLSICQKGYGDIAKKPRTSTGI